MPKRNIDTCSPSHMRVLEFTRTCIMVFLLMQEEIVDETDEFVDVHKRYLILRMY